MWMDVIAGEVTLTLKSHPDFDSNYYPNIDLNLNMQISGFYFVFSFSLVFLDCFRN